MMFLGTQRKLIQIFRTFVEKAFVPQIKKIEGSLFEWSKFLFMLSMDPLNLNDIQLFVDTLPSLENYNNKKNDVDNTEVRNCQSSKSLGGTKNNNYQFIEPEFMEPKGNDALRQRVSQTNNNNMLTNIEKLLKNFEENQNLIDGLNKDNPQSESNSKEKNNPIMTNGPIQIPSQNYNFFPMGQTPLMQTNVPSQSFTPHISAHSVAVNFQKAGY